MEEMKYHLDVCATGFNEEAWDHVCKEFNQETSLNYDKMELKKHLAVLRKRYRIVKPLYNHGGFGWDYRRKMVDVDDLVWKEYIEVHKYFRLFRARARAICFSHILFMFNSSYITKFQLVKLIGAS